MTTSIYKTSDYLTTDEILRLIRYFKKLGNHRMCLLIEFGVKTLLRYSDLSILKEGGRDVKIRNKNISTHSLRKSGSRFIWENNGNSDEYLIKLSSILNHSSTSITRRYLGISREEIKDIYQSFDELL